MNNQLNITITSNGTTGHYSAHKIASNILLEDNFGLYKNSTPDATNIFKFINKTDWYGYVNPIEKPLMNSLHGSLDVNFDTKTITSKREVNPFLLSPTWLISSVDKALKSEDGYITSDSIFDHIQNSRIYTLNSNNEKQTYSKDPVEFLNEVKIISQDFFINTPDGWTFMNN